MNDLRGRGSVLLIVEDDHRGHRLAYVRAVALAGGGEFARVIVGVTSDGLASPEWELFMGDVSRRIHVEEINQADLSSIRRLSTLVGSDMTVVLEGDDILTDLVRVGWGGAGRLSVLVMRNSPTSRSVFAASRLRFAVKRIAMLLAHFRRRVRLVTLRSPFDKSRRWFHSVTDPTVVATSPALENAARDFAGMSKAVRWVTVVGAISARKNATMVARAVLQIGSPSVGLLVSGRIEADVLESIQPILEELAVAGVPYRVVDELLSAEIFDGIISSSDVVVLAHSNEGPSGILAKAAALGTPVVASGAESLRRDVSSFRSSAVWVPLTIEVLSGGIRRMLDAPAATRSTSDEMAASSTFLRELIGE